MCAFFYVLPKYILLYGIKEFNIKDHHHREDNM